MKINKKIVLLLSVLIPILFILFFSISPKAILPENVAYIFFLFVYLAPASFLGYDVCFMSGPGCASNVPFFVYFIGPAIFIAISTVVIYPAIIFTSKIARGLIHRDFTDKVFSLKYYRKLLILIGCALVLTSFLYINRVIETQKYKKEVERTNAPEYVLREYYQFNVDFYNRKISDDPFLGRRFVTDNFVNKIKKTADLYSMNLPFNAICSQDFPKDASGLVFKEIYKGENTTKFEVYVFKRPLVVTLVNNDGSIKEDIYGDKQSLWLIDDINCNY